jgi:hypothetical protein
MDSYKLIIILPLTTGLFVFFIYNPIIVCINWSNCWRAPQKPTGEGKHRDNYHGQ